MAVKKLTRASAKAAPAPKQRARAAPPGLPTAATVASQDIRDYACMVYAREKWGKTTFFSKFPGAMFLCCEPGAKGLSIYSYNGKEGVTNWQMFLSAVTALEAAAGSGQFLNVVVDTLDEAYRMCFDFVCKRAGVEHPHDADDFGKTWQGVTKEFLGTMRRIKSAGYGLYMTSHAKEVEIKSASGTKFHRIGPSMSGKDGERVLAYVDFIFYGEYMRDDRGQVRRVLVTRGDDLIIAGQRKVGVGFPTYVGLPIDEDEDYNVFCRAFQGEEGLDPTKLQIAANTSKAGAARATRDRLNAKRGS